MSEGTAEGGVKGKEFRRARAKGWEAARPCSSKETKLAKNVRNTNFLIAFYYFHQKQTHRRQFL